MSSYIGFSSVATASIVFRKFELRRRKYDNFDPFKITAQCLEPCYEVSVSIGVGKKRIFTDGFNKSPRAQGFENLA